MEGEEMTDDDFPGDCETCLTCGGVIGEDCPPSEQRGYCGTCTGSWPDRVGEDAMLDPEFRP